MTAFSSLIEQTRQKLNRKDTLNKLNGAVSSGASSIALTYDITGVAAGARVSVDLEDFHVWEATTATKTLTVQPGANGSTQASHLNSSYVYMNPEYSPFEIGQAINDELASLPGEGVYKFTNVTLTADASKTGYDLTSSTNLLGVHTVRYQAAGSSNDWPVLPRSAWDVQLGLPTTSFASGNALFVYDYVQPGNSIRVLYKTVFTSLNLTTAGLAEDVETTSGLPASAHSLLATGAALRLTQGRPSARADLTAQGDPRRAAEVNTNDMRLAASPLALERQDAIKRARADQVRKYGL